jgi:hypothetical protein
LARSVSASDGCSSGCRIVGLLGTARIQSRLTGFEQIRIRLLYLAKPKLTLRGQWRITRLARQALAAAEARPATRE